MLSFACETNRKSFHPLNILNDSMKIIKDACEEKVKKLILKAFTAFLRSHSEIKTLNF